MTTAMQKKVAEENKKPLYYGDKHGQVIKRARYRYNPDNDTMSTGFNVCVCIVSEYLDNPEEAAQFIAAALCEYEENHKDDS